MEKLHHVGIVVKDVDAAFKQYNEMFGFTLWDKGIVEDTKDGVRMGLIPIGDNFVELIQPTKTGNRYDNFLKERGEGLFHLSIFINNYDERVQSLREKGVRIEEHVARGLFPGYAVRLAFVPPEYTRGPWIEYVDMDSMPPEEV